MKPLFICLFMLSTGCRLAAAQPCQTGRLDPRVANALRTVLSDLPSSLTTSVEQIRDVRIKAPAFPEADVRYLNVTADSIPIRVYNPAHTTGIPIIISYHPGGFVTPMLPFMAYECWRQAKTYNAIVVAVDYRVAPEHPFPAAVNDAYAAFKWVAQHGHRFGGDTSRIVVLGASAGGNLAAVVCQKAKAEGLADRIKLQVLNCPSTDHPQNFARHPSYQRYATGYFLTKAFCQYSVRMYAPNGAIDNPEVAPLQRINVADLPPALIITAEFDPLRDEGYAYAERLKQAGVPIKYHCFAGQIHCLLGLPPEATELRELDQLITAEMHKTLRRKLSTRKIGMHTNNRVIQIVVKKTLNLGFLKRIMKINPLLYALPVLLLSSCFKGDNATTTDAANDAAGTGSPYLAREVVGVWQLSTDQRFGYDEPCNVLDEGLIQSTFDIKLTDEMQTLDYPNGCQFKWSGGTASIAFGGEKPYPSIYHAEYIFDKNYQGGAGQVSGQMGETGQKAPISGPATEGIGAERPVTEPEGSASGDIDADSTAGNDSSSSVSGVTSVAAQFTKPVVSTGNFVAMTGVGDKAVWEPAKSTLHVLYNNHIVNVRIQTKANEATRQQKASSLANLVLNHFTEDASL